jgi:hypothetical protein
VSTPAETGIRSPRPSPKPTRQVIPAANSVWWLALVAAAFTLAQLAFVVPHLGLSWDEVVYVSQVSVHAPAAYFDPARARGIPLLVAPAALLTSSVLALRFYLSVASGLGLFLALLVWHRLRPAWILALAGVFFGGLWVAQYYGPQAMPDEWVAFSALAAVGFFLRAVPSTTGEPEAGEPEIRVRWRELAGLAGCIAIAALVRPGDALYLCAALGLAVLAVRKWRDWRPLVAIAAGFVAGAADWVVEAYVRFGGPLARLRAAGAEQGGFGLHFALWDEFKAVNGPTLCRPCTVAVRYPGVSAWWLALPVLAVLGVLAARRYGRFDSSLLAAVCGLAIGLQYLFLINYAAPRFLLPAYALAAIPVGDALAGFITGIRSDARPAAITLVGVVLFAQLVIQNTVLSHQVGEKITFFGDYSRIAADLHRLGVKPPCLVKGDQYIPIAFYAGCASAPPVTAAHPAGERIAVLVAAGASPPGYARGWTRHYLPGIRTKLLKMVAYLPPGTS